MIYSTDMQVKVKDTDGTLVMGRLIQPADFDGSDAMWWVKHRDEVSLFSESSLNYWNTVSECTCGATKAYAPQIAPGHAYHCETRTCA